MRNAGLDEAQAGIKIAGRNINKLRYADDSTLMAERELKSLLMKEQSEKASLKLNIQKIKIMASNPIISWKIEKFYKMGMPEHLICVLRNLYADQEATVRTGHGKMHWFKIGKRSMLRLYIVTLHI